MFGFPATTTLQGTDLSAEEKQMTVKKYIEVSHQQLNEQVQEFNRLSEESKQIDQSIYNAYFSLKDCFNQISKIYDQQLQHQQDMNVLSQEQLNLNNELIAPATELESANNLFNVVLKTQQMNEWLQQQIIQDDQLYQSINDATIIIKDAMRHLGI